MRWKVPLWRMGYRCNNRILQHILIHHVCSLDHSPMNFIILVLTPSHEFNFGRTSR